jgi:hypothetical protein
MTASALLLTPTVVIVSPRRRTAWQAALVQ